MTDIFKDGLEDVYGDLVLTAHQAEQLYQAFKARLKAEAVLNVWPEPKTPSTQL